MDYLQSLEKIARQNNIPVILDEGRDFLCGFCKKHNFKSVLEIGTAVGYSGCFILQNLEESHLTTIEKNEESAAVATQTFLQMGLQERVTQIVGDAKEEIEKIDQKFDFIFLDGPKGQYINYIDRLKQMLNKDGYILADNVLFKGLVRGQEFVEKKKRTIVVNLRKFLNKIKQDKDFEVEVFEDGDGIAVIKKIN